MVRAWRARSGGAQDHIHQWGRQRERSAAQLVEQAFGEMAQLDHRGCVQEAGATLDGVETAENVVQQPAVSGTLFQFHQLVVDIGQEFRRLGQEVQQYLFHALEVDHGLKFPIFRSMDCSSAEQRPQRVGQHHRIKFPDIGIHAHACPSHGWPARTTTSASHTGTPRTAGRI